MSRPASEPVGTDSVSVGIAARRVRQLRVHVGVAALAFVLGLIALAGGVDSVFAILVVLILTFTALMLSLRGWRGAAEVWAGRADPARLRNLTLWSLAFGTPALVATLIAALFVLVMPLARLMGLVIRHSPWSSSQWAVANVGAVRWTDPVVFAAVAAAVVASAAAAMLAVRLRRPTRP